MAFSVLKPFKSVKYVLGTVNVLFLLTGLLLIIVGTVVLVFNNEYEALITRRFFTMPAFVIATGVIICLSSLVGFYAAISQSFYFIAAYTILLIIVLVFEISMVIVAYGMEGNAASQISDIMQESRKQYGSLYQISQMWDDLQREFSCCGVGGRFDYASSLIPLSCCHIDYGVVGEFRCETSNAYTIGCAEALGELLSYNSHVVAVSALVATCIQIPVTAIAAWMTYRTKFHEVELES
ncbi:tetraspanin family domain-containing protein [Phthorimaea operculella]|nr:tetraspanin family domain-containing protein [Phthorimaea operculella]